MRKTVSAMEARRKFGELLEDVSRGDAVVIERNGKPMGVLVSPDQYAILDRNRDRVMEFVMEARERAKQMGVTEDEVEREALEAVRAVRSKSRKGKKSA